MGMVVLVNVIMAKFYSLNVFSLL